MLFDHHHHLPRENCIVASLKYVASFGSGGNTCLCCGVLVAVTVLNQGNRKAEKKLALVACLLSVCGCKNVACNFCCFHLESPISQFLQRFTKIYFNSKMYLPNHLPDQEHFAACFVRK